MYFRGETNNGSAAAIAIVGAALRFPGAADPASFHELSVTGRRMFREVPQLAAHRETARLYGGGALAAPPVPLLRAALLDPAPPGPGEEEATARHRLAAETAAAALADLPGGSGPAPPPRRTGAVVADLPGLGGPDVTGWVRMRLGLASHDWIPRYSCSLRAVAAACELLAADHLDLVLAGGVSLGIDPVWVAYRSHSGALAADGDVRVYDVSPTGTLPGEGCGMVALMRARDARAAGLGVYAEIAGWEAADDIAAPSAAIRGAYLRAGVDPADVAYVEGHGAGTAVDDLAELTALLDVLAPRRDGTPGACALGSVTANIGDTRGAAGAASLLKTALALSAGVVPPSTGCVRPHQLLRAGAAPFRLPSEPGPWPEVPERLAAVNSLGTADLAGSTRSGPVHLVLRRDSESGHGSRRRRAATAFRVPPRPREAPDDSGAPTAIPPQRQQRDQRERDNGTFGPAAGGGGGLVAGTSGGLAAGAGGGLVADTLAGDWVITARGANAGDLAVTLDAIAITACRLSGEALGDFAREMASAPARPDFRARAGLVARDPVQLAERARRAAAVLRERPPGSYAAGTGSYVSDGAAGRIALLFPGLVSTGVEHSAVLSATMATLGAAERLGLRPRLGVGYSFGEIAGLAWAGVVTFGEAARLAAHRAEIIRATPGRAAMARLQASPAAVAGLCSGTGLSVAVHEGPVQHVVAGPVSDIRELPQRAAERGMETEVLSVAHALHSAAMSPAAAPMRAVVAGLRFAEPRQRLISTVTGLDITGSDDPAALIAGQLTRPALLSGALALACADSDLILLTARDPALARIAGDSDRVPVVQAPLDQRLGTVLPSALAAFFSAGAIDSVLPFLPGGSPEPGSRRGGGPGQSEAAARA
ncbi:MAG: acyltransferase domain-containing protein [Streptosporangiales bacterium]|nr:acyltransferase domain-containing protein [Streptosporangiales bacterium]